ncbi:hypothetical protein KW792_00820 [Candidatus Saccharibacteria bacterium]|nr:hypothetical protein [Candidatus Saccharibacteria bacterium]
MAKYDSEIFNDEYIMASLPDAPDEFPVRPELIERDGVFRTPRPAQWLARLNQAVDSASENISRHKITSFAVGGVVMASVGLAGGAAIFGRR